MKAWHRSTLTSILSLKKGQAEGGVYVHDIADEESWSPLLFERGEGRVRS
jgi:hypothetical protein